MPARVRAAPTSDAAIQRKVFLAFGQSIESQRFAKSAVRLVAKFRRILPSAPRRRKRPAAAGAKAKRKWLAGFEKRAFRLASDIDRIQGDMSLWSAFDSLHDSLRGRPPPGFPQTGVLFDATLDMQFLNVLALAFSAREVGRTWSPKRGAPRMSARDLVLQQLAREFENSFGIAPSIRKRDSFSQVAELVLLACGFQKVDARDAIAAALTGPGRGGVTRILLMSEPKLRELPEVKRGRGKK